MSKKTIKIVSLNLWNFNKWEGRLPLIIETIKKNNPDIVLLQEVQKNPLFSNFDQVHILNEKLSYDYSTFKQAFLKKKSKGIDLEFSIEHGLGVLSKFPFESEVIKLTQSLDDKEPRILLKNVFTIDESKYTITNLHFANKDDWSEAHLKETFEIFKSQKTILAGDFNIKNLSQFSSIYKDKYISSSDLYDYVSYPEDGLSYDYFLLPKDVKLLAFECLEESISDHRMIVATIEI